MTYVDRFLNYIDTLPDFLIYIMLGLSSFVENIFPPAPGDTVMVFGAFLVGIGRLDFQGMYISTTIGSLAGFMFLFWIGSLLGRRYFVKMDYRIFSAEKIARAEDWFERYGYFIVLINRFLPGVRSVISLVSGLSGLNTIKVCFLALISGAVWNLIWIAMGFTLGVNWETAKHQFSSIMAGYNIAVITIFILIFLVWAIWKMTKNRQ